MEDNGICVPWNQSSVYMVDGGWLAERSDNLGEDSWEEDEYKRAKHDT